MASGVTQGLSPEEGTTPGRVNEAGEVLPPSEQQVGGSTFWDFLSSESGKSITNKLLDMVQSLQKSTIEANAEQSKKQLENAATTQRQNMEFQHGNWRFWMWLQGTMFVTCILATVLLAWNDKLSGPASTVILTVLGFLFGRTTTRSQ